MINIALLVLSIGVSISVVVFTISHSYRILHDLSKKKAPDPTNPVSGIPKKDDQDLLLQQLEEFQRQRFGKPMNVHSERTRMIAQRIRMEEGAKKKNAN